MRFADGRILLVDSRQNASSSESRHLMGNLQFKQGSAITHLKSLDNISSGHSLLAAGMDGSIALWDTRFPTPDNSPSRSKSSRRLGKNQCRFSQPIRRFYGHSNNHSRQLAFDVDTNLRLMTMAGDDNVVRIWSLSDQENEVHPFWYSKTYDDQVCQAKIIPRPPLAQKIWSRFDGVGADGFHSYKPSNPGLLVCAPSLSLEWYSIPG
jgi:WD40 repeat protein